MKKIWISSGVERMNSMKTEIGQPVQRDRDAQDREHEADERGEDEAEDRRLDGDDGGLRQHRQNLEGVVPVPDHRARPRARPRAARSSSARMRDGDDRAMRR